LRDEGYTDISTQEVLVRTHDIAQPPPTSSSQLSDISSIVERLKTHEARKEERRVLQMKTARERTVKMKEKEKEKSAAGRAAATATTEAAGSTEMMETATGAEEATPTTGEKRPADETDDTSSKKPRLETETEGAERPTRSTDESKPNPNPARVRDQAKLDQLQALLAYTPPTRPSLNWTEPDPYPSSLILTKPASEMRGHTSYLTFATLHPLAIRTEVAPVAKSRVDALKSEAVVASPTEGSGSEYGSEGLEEVMRTMTEEEMIALSAV
jgi:tRNA (adenine57-N1/adenine58-N1)-methyltransferase